MKKGLYAAVAMSALVVPTWAQPQQPPTDPALIACQQLLTGANNNLIQIAAQATMLSRQLEAAQSELARAKEKGPEPKSTEPKP